MELTDREVTIIAEALRFFIMNQSFADIKEVEEVQQALDKFETEERTRSMV